VKTPSSRPLQVRRSSRPRRGRSQLTSWAAVPTALRAAVLVSWVWLLTWATIPGERSAKGAGERGDVPGWVMITLMTAGLVAALWILAGDRFEALFTQAMNAVTGRL
jgi:hypothetical protein